ISEGWEKKNLSTHPSRVVSSQLPSQTTAKRTRRTLTVQRRRRASRARFAARSVTGLTAGPVVAAMAALGRAAALLTLIAHQDLVAEVVPDLFVDLGKARLEADLGDVARPGQVDLVAALARSPQVARAGGDVLQHRLPGKDGVGLEDIADALGDAVDGLPEHLDLAFAGRLQAGDQGERRRLPTAGRSHYGAELAGCDREVEIVEGGI